MDILFIHQNFPAQFKHVAPALVAGGHRCVALVRGDRTPAAAGEVWQGVRVLGFRTARPSSPGIHPWLTDLETKVIRGQACLDAMLQLKAKGFTPDVVIAHPGWGESLFAKDVWPGTRLGIYCEFFYQASGADVGFDPEFLSPGDPAQEQARIRIKNINHLLHLDIADAGISPTQWQAATFPEPFRQRIDVVHDGIDTHLVAPNPSVKLSLQTANGAVALTRQDEVITFVNRNLEPYRGYHVFMRALPELLRRRPRARVLIVGGDGTSYGAVPDPARYGGLQSWKEIFAREVRPHIADADWQRVHFLGQLAYPKFIALLQLSTVHVYLTYPFVLGWSLLEAMSAGCAIVASNTAPVREAIEDGKTGRLVDFFDVAQLTDRVCELLDDGPARQTLGQAARAFAQAHYDLQLVCLPRQLQWVQRLAGLV